jgi:hypothetical protein
VINSMGDGNIAYFSMVSLAILSQSDGYSRPGVPAKPV